MRQTPREDQEQPESDVIRTLMRRPVPQGCSIVVCEPGECWGREVPLKPAEEAPKVVYTRADVDVTPERLLPGAVIDRWTDNAADGRHVWAPLPCHPAQFAYADTRQGEAIVQCRLCPATFLLDVVDDGDGGFTARYTVSYVPVLLSRANSRLERA